MNYIKSDFWIGQRVRFWSMEECFEHNQRLGTLNFITQLREFIQPWDTVVQVISVGQYLRVRFPNGVELEVDRVAVSTDLHTEYQLAINALGEDYFG